ncbi:MAG: RHS repeat-associated core domain-containing protein [Proteobacteria bacterium]|nr:MAG: RHS repeat-associated core domain-containing protein [Pseudomonadota bacterium]
MSPIILQTIQDKNAFGHVTREVSGNNIHTYREYDVSGRMKLLMTGHGNGGSDIQYMTYQYDAVGNMTVRNDSRVIGNELIEEFTYDRVNRIERVDTTFTDPYFGLIELTDYDITYDAGGRRSTLKHGHAPSITYNYDPNHIHGVSGTTDGKSYGYDAVGNQTLSDGRVLDYTAFNKAKRMSQGSYAVEYSYGANNEKLTRKDIYSGEETLTWYVGNVEIVTTNWSGGVPESIKYKRYLGDNTVVTHHGPEIIDIDYMFKDHLGSTQVIASHAPSGYGVRHLSYDAFGKNRPITRPDPILNYFLISNITNRGFTGQDHVSELSLINFNARMYDPNLGMMLQADTVVPDGPVVDSLNRYAYVYNNPLSYADPTGNTPKSVIDPWYHMRQEYNRMLPPNTTRDTNGLMGGSGVSQRALPQERDNTTTQNDMPAGVNGGSMGNGDLAFGINNSGQGWDGTPRPRSRIKTKKKDFSNDENALRDMDFEPHLGPDDTIETKIFVDGSSESVLGTSQKGCSGDDRCILYKNEYPNATLLVHNHLEPVVAESGKNKSTHVKATELARDIPGHGDHNPLKLNMTSGVITARGYRYHITGKPNSPKIKYLGGGEDENFGKYVEQNWRPGVPALMLKIAKDYLKNN